MADAKRGEVEQSGVRRSGAARRRNVCREKERLEPLPFYTTFKTHPSKPCRDASFTAHQQGATRLRVIKGTHCNLSRPESPNPKKYAPLLVQKIPRVNRLGDTPRVTGEPNVLFITLTRPYYSSISLHLYLLIIFLFPYISISSLYFYFLISLSPDYIPLPLYLYFLIIFLFP